MALFDYFFRLLYLVQQFFGAYLLISSIHSIIVVDSINIIKSCRSCFRLVIIGISRVHILRFRQEWYFSFPILNNPMSKLKNSYIVKSRKITIQHVFFDCKKKSCLAKDVRLLRGHLIAIEHSETVFRDHVLVSFISQKLTIFFESKDYFG